jgi:Family of unknown function (DUF5681)
MAKYKKAKKQKAKPTTQEKKPVPPDIPSPPENTRENTRTLDIQREANGTFKRGYCASPELMWQKGQSGNPNGRPKKLTNLLDERLATKVPNDPEGRCYAEVLVAEVLKRAITHSDILAKEVFDRIEGKQQQSSEVNANLGVRVIVLNSPRPGRPILPAPTNAVPTPKE